ncbi:nucleotidyl transferase AbiEii/AbiGii toxin family protein [Terribacillus saccharophilus]|uniref:nucleotidyl transferase AbiEii/AbiGii toxin family protein n=1 Tax=Terribacillus saccharophilus TaxID=361277 RepID=UPI003D2BE438
MPNVQASILARLKKVSSAQRKAHNLILRLYFQERLLFRLSLSPYKERFILKGGLFLYSLSENMSRPTKDMDFLGKQISNDMEAIKKAFKVVCQITPEVDDGVTFDVDSIDIERIKEDADYEGVRLKLMGKIGVVTERLQLDIGFGDIVIPDAEIREYPTLLNSEKPEILSYTLESVISEKFEAMISLSIANTRLKDFYDIYSMLSIKKFEGLVLYEAIFETFQKRGTNIIKDHVLFSNEFSEDEQRNNQWNAFLNRSGFEYLPFTEVMDKLTIFLKPLYESIIAQDEFLANWNIKDQEWIRIT